MAQQQISIKASDGTMLHGTHWALDQPKAIVVLVHGLGEHVDRYAHMAAAYAKEGFAMLGFDRRGHGRSEGQRGHTPSLAHLLDELNLAIAFAKKSYPNVPVILFGHSMGGNLVLTYALQEQREELAGIISSAPWIRLVKPPGALLVAAAKLLTPIMPGVAQSNGLDASHLSKDQQVVDAYINDPLVHDKITLQTGLSLMNAATELDTFKGSIDFPLLMIHGKEDQITDPKGSAAFAKRVGGPIEYQMYDGLYHEMHNEVEQQEVFNKATNWMKEILS
ncbi:MAG: lysophospholipase [Bacteroidota bacterium]